MNPSYENYQKPNIVSSFVSNILFRNFLAFYQQLVADIVIAESLSIKSSVVGMEAALRRGEGGGQDAVTAPLIQANLGGQIDLHFDPN